MTEKKQLQLEIPKLVSLACNILHQGFVKNPRDKAKTLFKELKNGKKVSPGSLTLDKTVDIKLELEFDGSEFKGGLNYPAFEAALKAMLSRISTKLNSQADLNIMTSAEGEMLFNVPGIIQHKSQVNILMMAIAPRPEQVMAIRLMFIDPSQFERQDEDVVEVEEENEA